jgi:hypothetical protein
MIGEVDGDVARWLGDHLTGDWEAKMAGKLTEEDMQYVADRLVEAFPPEVLARIVGRRLRAGMTVEQRLEGLSPEQRLAGLDPHAALLALPDDALRALPKAYIDGLPDDIRTKVEARLADTD